MLDGQRCQRRERVRECFLVLVIARDERLCPGGADEGQGMARLACSVPVDRGDALRIFAAPGAHVRLDEVRRLLGHAGFEVCHGFCELASPKSEKAEGRLDICDSASWAGKVVDLGDTLQAFRAASAQCIQPCEERESIRARPLLLCILRELQRFRARGVRVYPASRSELEAGEMNERERKSGERSAIAGDRHCVAYEVPYRLIVVPILDERVRVGEERVGVVYELPIRLEQRLGTREQVDPLSALARPREGTRERHDRMELGLAAVTRGKLVCATPDGNPLVHGRRCDGGRKQTRRTRRVEGLNSLGLPVHPAEPGLARGRETRRTEEPLRRNDVAATMQRAFRRLVQLEGDCLVRARGRRGQMKRAPFPGTRRRERFVGRTLLRGRGTVIDRLAYKWLPELQASVFERNQLGRLALLERCGRNARDRTILCDRVQRLRVGGGRSDEGVAGCRRKRGGRTEVPRVGRRPDRQWGGKRRTAGQLVGAQCGGRLDEGSWIPAGGVSDATCDV